MAGAHARWRVWGPSACLHPLCVELVRPQAFSSISVIGCPHALSVSHPCQLLPLLCCSAATAAAPQVFFCKYNDPIYVKMEKLEIMIKLANDKNIDQVLLEFKEYAQEVDVDFVRKVGARRVLAVCSRRWVAGDCAAVCERLASMFAGWCASQHRQIHALCLLVHMCTVSVL